MYLRFLSKKLINGHATFYNVSKRLFMKSYFVPFQARSMISASQIYNSAIGTTEDSTYDIIVSGGGLVGSAMICSLVSSSYFEDKKILLLEGGPPIPYQDEMPKKYSNRVIAINPGSVNLLTDLGVWQLVLRSCPVKRMQVWDALSPSSISFQHSDMHINITHIVENSLILRALSQRLSELNAKVMHNVKVTKYIMPQKSGGLVSLELQDGTRLQTRLLIGADGFNSLVRRTMNSNYISWNYNQNAIVANLKLSEAVENNVAWQKFLPTGPVALLPLTSDLSSLVWTMTPSMSEKLMAMPEDRFVDELNSALWQEEKPHPIVEGVSRTVKKYLEFFSNSGSAVQLPPSILELEVGSRASFPLGLGHASNYIKPGVAIIGDSAHRVHPLAGLGVNLGFGDVNCLTRTLEDSIGIGNQIGHPKALQDYESERQKHNVPIMAAIDGLNKLYSTSFLPLVLLRSLGLQITDAVIPIKNQFVEMASR